MLRRMFSTVAVFALLFATSISLVAAPATVQAKDIFNEACSTPAAVASPTCQSQKSGGANPLTGTDGTLYKVTTIIAVLTGIAAVIVIIISGFRYITSGGDTQKIASAKGALIGAIVGLVIIVLAQTIITFVMRKIG